MADLNYNGDSIFLISFYAGYVCISSVNMSIFQQINDDDDD